MTNLKNILTICCHDLLDQVRDRRTLFMIIILPLVLYPLAGELIVNLAVGQQLRPKKIIVVNSAEVSTVSSAQFQSSLLVSFAAQSGCLGGINPAPVLATGVMAYLLVDQMHPPPLFVMDDEKLRISHQYGAEESFASLATWGKGIISNEDLGDPQKLNQAAEGFIAAGADAVLVFPTNFSRKVALGQTVQVILIPNEKDESNKLMEGQIRELIFKWGSRLRSARFLSRGLASNFHQVIEIVEPDTGKAGGSGFQKTIRKELQGAIKRILPLMLVMWALVGALYPAVDLCAGEKERGTMETLLISAATRSEIVLGKFLAIWAFSTVTALLNIVTLGVTATHLSMTYMNMSLFYPMLMVWALLLLLPLGAFFSALSLAIGAYARSSREGQYYLMPLVMITLPLVLITIAPGTKLDLPTCFVPITGIAILLQELSDASNLDLRHLVYLLAVLGATASYAFLALKWAVRQFNREEVLFREAEQFHWPSIFKSILPAHKTASGIGVALVAYFLVLLLGHLSKNLLAGFKVDPSVAGIIPIGLLLCFWMKSPNSLIIFKSPGWLGISVALVVGLALIPVTTQLSLFDGKAEVFKNLFDELQRGNFGGRGVIDMGPFSIMGLLLLPLIVSEFVFRGFLLGNLKGFMGMIEAAVITALMFAAQSFQPVRFLPDLVSGFFLALLVLRFNSIWVAFIAHLVMVFPAIFAFFSFSSAQSLNMGDQAFQNAWITWNFLGAVSVLVLLCCGVFMVWPDFLLARIERIKSQIQTGSLSD